MKARSFLDTNLLVYADQSGPDPRIQASRALIRAGLQTGRGVISTQVLSEYFFASTRKLKTPPENARAKVAAYGNLEVVLIQSDDVLAAIDYVRLNSVPYWDALILRCALKSQCRFLLTEDFNHGQKFDNLEIVNPFKD